MVLYRNRKPQKNFVNKFLKKVKRVIFWFIFAHVTLIAEEQKFSQKSHVFRVISLKQSSYFQRELNKGFFEKLSYARYRGTDMT